MDIWELLLRDIQFCILSLLFVKDLLKLRSVSKSWQSIIASPIFCNLQFNANLYENHIIMKKYRNSHQFIIKSLESTEFCYFDLKQIYKFRDFCTCHIHIVSVNNGLILFEIMTKFYFPTQFVVCNPETKELIKLPQLNCSQVLELKDDLLVDLQSNTYKIFLLLYSKINSLTFYLYNSLTNTWQSLDSFSKFRSNFQFGFFNFHIMLFKEKLYATLKTRTNSLMMVVYDPIIDTWNKLDVTFLANEGCFGKFFIANDC
jgi:hypothetical protein